jgi:hypothetical protein
MNYLNIRTICLQASFYSQFLAWVACGPHIEADVKHDVEDPAKYDAAGQEKFRGFRLNIV